MPRKKGRALLSRFGELMFGICLMLIAVIFIYGNAGRVATGIVFWFGFVLLVHALWRYARQRIRRRRLPVGPMLVLLLCGVVWLSFPTNSYAAAAGSVHGGGQIYPPTTTIKGWWGTHTSNDPPPPTGCRKASGWTEGTYPSLVLSVSPLGFSWRKTYIFSTWMKVCWTAKGYLGLNHEITSVRVFNYGFGDVDNELIKNPRYDHTETSWEVDNPGCARVRVKGVANLKPIPVPGVSVILPLVGEVTIHFWVDFNDVCPNGDMGEVRPDDNPY